MTRFTACAVLLCAATAVLAQDKTTALLGTATPGGGFPVYGAAFAATVNEVEPGLRIETQNTRGSGENIPLLEAGKLDLGLVQGESAHEALDGIGLDQDRDFRAVYLDRAGDGPPMALDGRVAALWGGGVGWPGFSAMAKNPGGARFISPDAGEIRRILAKHAFLKPLSVPAGTYPGQGGPIDSVGSWSFVMAGPALPDAVAYKLMRAVHRGEAALAKRLPAAAETTAANTYAAAPRAALIHPGALRYLREAGIAK